jgi:thioredoxin 1
METLKNMEALADVKKNKAVMLYISNEQCSVCKVLKPKVEEMIGSEFPKMGMYYINSEESPALSAAEMAFTVPVLLVYFEGRESIRLVRNFGIDELRQRIGRSYAMLFG